MLKKLAIAALAASVPFVAIGQTNVTVYGLTDVGVATETTGAPGNRKLSLSPGIQSGNRLGFRGKEDLGGGLSVMFTLETGFNIDNGTLGQGGLLFGRRAVVGLDGGFGLLTLGREYTPIAMVAGATDPMEHGFYATDLSAFSAARNRIIRRADNTINYRSPSFGGLQARFVYGFGEGATDPKLGDLIGLSVDYTSKSLYLGAGYHEKENVAAGNDKRYILGAGYKFGAFNVKANYLASDAFGLNNKYEQVNLGVSARFGAGRVYTNIQKVRDETGAKATGFGIAYSHELSKRTNVFTTYGTLKNNELGRFNLNSAGSTLTPTEAQLGSDPSGFAVGIRHKF